MNHIPKDLRGFDFIWSSCSLEHLGSLKHGEYFVYNAMRCLKPGGIAVHTTEYNFSSNEETLDTGGTVLYRRCDIEQIVKRLQYRGHKISLDFASGDLPDDQFIDMPPYKHDPHLKLQLLQYVITSMGLIIEKYEGLHLKFLPSLAR
jgi:SAM-dependent methyltransferase